MTPFVVLCMVGAVISSVMRWLKSASGDAPGAVKLHCRNSMTVRLDIHRTASLAGEVFRNLGWRLVIESATLQRFSRGDDSIRRLPFSRDVAWRELPVILSLRLVGEGAISRIDAEYVTRPLDACDQASFDQFLRLAGQEFDEAVASMDAEARRIRASGGQAAQDDERVGGYRKASERAAALMGDFEALGLTIKASWQEIQAAYHEACFKYHPDRLTDTPKHLVDLAVSRFKDITEAYHRLKDHFRG